MFVRPVVPDDCLDGADRENRTLLAPDGDGDRTEFHERHHGVCTSSLYATASSSSRRGLGRIARESGASRSPHSERGAASAYAGAVRDFIRLHPYRNSTIMPPKAARSPLSMRVAFEARSFSRLVAGFTSSSVRRDRDAVPMETDGRDDGGQHHHRGTEPRKVRGIFDVLVQRFRADPLGSFFLRRGLSGRGGSLARPGTIAAASRASEPTFIRPIDLHRDAAITDIPPDGRALRCQP